MSEFLTFDKNEIKNVWITVTERDGGTVSLSTCTFAVYDTSGTAVQASGSATVSDNDTASPDVYGLVNTTPTTITACSTYYVTFSIIIDSETYLTDIPIKVV